MKLFTPRHGCASTYILHVHQVHVMHGKINWNWNHGKITWNHGKIDEHREKSMKTMGKSMNTRTNRFKSFLESIEIQYHHHHHHRHHHRHRHHHHDKTLGVVAPRSMQWLQIWAFGNQETRGSCWLQCRYYSGAKMVIPLRQISRDISDTYSDTLTFFVGMLFGILLVSDIYILYYILTFYLAFHLTYKMTYYLA